MRLRTARHLLPLLLVAAIVTGACDASSVLSLPRAKIGARCAPAGAFARDASRVLQCVKGRWKVNMTIGQAVTLIDAYNRAEEAKRQAAQPVPTAPAATAPVATTPPTTAAPVTSPPTTAAPAYVKVGGRDQIAVTSDQGVCLVIAGRLKCGSADPTFDQGIDPTTIAAISARSGAVCAVTTSHQAVCRGDVMVTRFGDAGQPTIGASDLTLAYGVGAAVAVSGSCFLEVAGSVTCVGHNYVHHVAGLTDAVALSGTCAERQTGAVVCWSVHNSNGDVVTTVAGFGSPTDLAARFDPGPGDGCAVTTTATVVCWPIASTASSPFTLGAATPVAGLSSIKQVAKMNTTQCALTTAGAVSCWTGSDAPHAIVGMPPITEIGGDDYGLWAIDGNHEMWLIYGTPWPDPVPPNGAIHWGQGLGWN